MNAVLEKANNAHTNGHALEIMHTNSSALNDGEMIDIASCLTHHFEVYFKDLDGSTPSHLHQMMLSACEKPLLEWVMEKTRQNQSLASEWLGMNRATLRKKLQQYDLL